MSEKYTEEEKNSNPIIAARVKRIGDTMGPTHVDEYTKLYWAYAMTSGTTWEEFLSACEIMTHRPLRKPNSRDWSP